MKIFGISGHSGMGKTTLLERLVPEARRRGLVVSLIKHSHKAIEIDRPGKDSFRLREAGCSEVLLLGHERWALMHELRGAPEPPLDYLVSRLQRCDLVLVEGFKTGDFPKLEVWRGELGRPPLWPGWPGIAAIATDTPDALAARLGTAAPGTALTPALSREREREREPVRHESPVSPPLPRAGEGWGEGAGGPPGIAYPALLDLADTAAIADFVLARAGHVEAG